MMASSRGSRTAVSSLLQHTRATSLRQLSTKAETSPATKTSKTEEDSSTNLASTSNLSAKSFLSAKNVPKRIPMSSPVLDKPLPMSFPSDTLRSFPSLLHFADPILDPHPENVLVSEPTADVPYRTTVTILNDPKYFEPQRPSAADVVLSGNSGADELDSEKYLPTITSLTSDEVRKLHRHAILVKRVTHMTTKGKDQSMYALVVAGNGDGLVGYGEGKDINHVKAGRKAFHQAVRNLDTVHIHKGTDGSRTIDATLSYKWGASTVIMRPRPAGFGLRVPPVIHALCRSAGIRDLSAEIRGSTNPMNVVKAALQILWGGAAPAGLGDGLDGSLRRNDTGRGQRDRTDIERTRGRRIAEVHIVKKSPSLSLSSVARD